MSCEACRMVVHRMCMVEGILSCEIWQKKKAGGESELQQNLRVTNTLEYLEVRGYNVFIRGNVRTFIKKCLLSREFFIHRFHCKIGQERRRRGKRRERYLGYQ